MITFKYDVQLKESIAAQYLHLRPRPWVAVVGILFQILFVAALASSWFRHRGFNSTDCLALFLILWTLLYFFAVLPFRARKVFKQNRFRLHETEGRIDESGISFKSDLGESHIPWDHFVKWKESRRLILLYPIDTQFLVLPKRCLGGVGGTADVLGLIGRGIKKKA